MGILLEVQGMCKYFPGVRANEDVSFSVNEGEIHAFLGENGAGKTTLMNCIYGLYTPDAGKVFWNGAEVSIKSIRDAIDLGIGMVHQHFMLVHNLTVLENVMLGMPSRFGPFLDKKGIAAGISELMTRYGLSVDLNAEIWQLPVGAQQKVEIVKILFRKAKLLILDEPTAVLTPDEVDSFFEMLRALKRQGHSVIIITHKLAEVAKIADRVTVLRAGKVVTTLDRSEIDIDALASMMVGRDFVFSSDPVVAERKGVALEVKDLRCFSDRKLEALHGVSFSIDGGEVLGIAGVSGNGQSELAEVLTGMRHAAGGSVRIDGRETLNFTPRQLYRRRLAHIPEDRQRVGLQMDFSVQENSVMGVYSDLPFAKGKWVKKSAIRKHAERLVREFNIKTPGVETPAKLLSGGNQQKLILGRELAKSPKVLIAVQPTRGLDIGATDFVQGQIAAAKQRGTAVLYISTELEEIIKMSDSIGVMFAGRLFGPFPAKEMNVDLIGAMMTGTWKGGPQHEES